MRCDANVMARVVPLAVVSIPAGFSDALRLEPSLRSGTVFMFQSLLGFLMRCDSTESINSYHFNRFNPCWVF